MTKQEQVILKAEQGQGLTVEEVKIYQKAVTPRQHVYGKYGTLKRKYLEDKGIDWTIADLPTYLHGVDKQADELQERCGKGLNRMSGTNARVIISKIAAD